MAGRHRVHHGYEYDNRRGYAPEVPPVCGYAQEILPARGYAPEVLPVRGPLRVPQHHGFLEEEVHVQNAELRRLFDDNHRLTDDRTALRRELNAAKDEVHHMNGVISNIQADQDTQLRELYDRGEKLESDVRATESLKGEAVQLRSEVQKLSNSKHDLQRQIKNLSAEHEKLQSDNRQIPRLRSELDELKQQLMHLRMAIDYEKKAGFELMEQRQGMEKNMISMSQEAEKLRADLVGSDARPWAAGGPHGIPFDGLDPCFPGHFSIGYGGKMGAADKSSLYGSGSTSWGGLDKHHGRGSRR